MPKSLQEIAAEYVERFGQGDSPEAADVQMQAMSLELLGALSEQVGSLSERVANLEAIIVAQFKQHE